MMLKEVGGISQIGRVDQLLLAPDWYQQLTERQLAAYVRYQFIRLHDGVNDWDSPTHTKYRLKWDGGKDAYGTNYKATWPKALSAIRAYAQAHPGESVILSPGAWVAARFSDIAESVVSDGYKKAAPPTRPTSLYDVNAPNIFFKYAQRFTDAFSMAVRVTAQLVDQRLVEMRQYAISDDARQFYVLCDHGYISTTPFLRYGFGVALGCKRAALRYLWSAALDYEAQQGLYDRALAATNTENFVAVELLNKVIDIRKHWITYHD